MMALFEYHYHQQDKSGILPLVMNEVHKAEQVISSCLDHGGC